MGLSGRIRRLEGLTQERDPEYTAARDRFKAKLADMAERHREAREEGLAIKLEGQSHASLMALVMSYPYGEVPWEVVSALQATTEKCSHEPQSVFVKVARLCLESRGAR